MVKKIISVATAFLMLCCMVPFYAFAESATCPKCGKDTLITNQDISVEIGEEVGLPLSLKRAYCSNCHYVKYEYNVLGVAGEQAYDDGDESHIINFLKSLKEQLLGKNATATKFAAGGGSTSGGGVGRHPDGYADDNGTPTYNSNGELQVVVYPKLGFDSVTNVQDYPSYSSKNKSYSVWTISGLNITGRSTYSGASDTCSVYFNYSFSAPISGTYYIASQQKYIKNLYSPSKNKFIYYYYSAGGWSIHLSAGQTASVSNNGSISFGCDMMGKVNSTVTSYFCPIILTVVPDTTTISNSNNITINNNTWNGNVYVDNSNNLTYIYPEYTTINENNETVTNISTNPIIYNNETKQYYTYDTVTNNYYYITYETTPTPTPSPSPTPAPTWTPGGGATRGGGVGRHPSDTDAADWTLHYYILNNRRYDAYYALKKTEVDTETKLPWVDNKKYISTTQIPIANGQYTVSVPDGVYWRVWSWDEASQTLTGVNSSNWHSTINNFLFNATGEYIFEFCKADGSDFDTAKDVTLKLKNDKITDYEDGGTIVEEPTPSPSPESTVTPSPTESPTPTATPTPGGGTVPTPGGDSGGNNSSSSDSGWNPFKWLTDLLKDIVEGILKAIWKLITALFGFLLWLLSLVGSLFPFIPGQAVLAVTSAVVIVAVIRIIKFITGR